MIREKWIIGVLNKLSSLAGECDSAAAIEHSKLTVEERKTLQNKIREACEYINTRLNTK